MLVLEGASDCGSAEITIDQALEQVRRLVGMGERPVDACKAVAKESGLRKSDIYAAFCNEK